MVKGESSFEEFKYGVKVVQRYIARFMALNEHPELETPDPWIERVVVSPAGKILRSPWFVRASESGKVRLGELRLPLPHSGRRELSHVEIAAFTDT